jgi:hypothetical protein
MHRSDSVVSDGLQLKVRRESKSPTKLATFPGKVPSDKPLLESFVQDSPLASTSPVRISSKANSINMSPAASASVKRNDANTISSDNSLQKSATNAPSKAKNETNMNISEPNLKLSYTSERHKGDMNSSQSKKERLDSGLAEANEVEAPPLSLPPIHIKRRVMVPELIETFYYHVESGTTLTYYPPNGIIPIIETRYEVRILFYFFKFAFLTPSFFSLF